MRPRQSKLTPKTGFTLIEVIVIITLGALIASMIVPFVGTALTESGAPVNELTDLYQIQQVMEKIAADYRKRLDDDTLVITGFKNDPTQDFSAAEIQDTITDTGLTVSATFIDYYDDANGQWNDSDGDGIYDPIDYGSTDTGLVLVTVEKDQQSLQAVFGE